MYLDQNHCKFEVSLGSWDPVSKVRHSLVTHHWLAGKLPQDPAAAALSHHPGSEESAAIDNSKKTASLDITRLILTRTQRLTALTDFKFTPDKTPGLRRGVHTIYNWDPLGKGKWRNTGYINHTPEVSQCKTDSIFSGLHDSIPQWARFSHVSHCSRTCTTSLHTDQSSRASSHLRFPLLTHTKMT